MRKTAFVIARLVEKVELIMMADDSSEIRMTPTSTALFRLKTELITVSELLNTDIAPAILALSSKEEDV
jgi:hypothetical protein